MLCLFDGSFAQIKNLYKGGEVWSSVVFVWDGAGVKRGGSSSLRREGLFCFWGFWDGVPGVGLGMYWRCCSVSHTPTRRRNHRDHLHSHVPVLLRSHGNISVM